MKEIQFPVKFKCPNCHTDEPLVTIASQREVDLGFFKPGDVRGTKHMAIQLADTEKLQRGEMFDKIIRILLIHYDICSKCGTEYVFQIDSHDIKMPKAPPLGKLNPRLALPNFPLSPPPETFNKN